MELRLQVPRSAELQGGGKRQQLFRGIPQTCGMEAAHISLQPGESFGERNTGANDEMLVFVEGEGRVLPHGSDDMQVCGGWSVYLPPQTYYDVKNMGSTPLRYVCVAAPAKGEI